jgi:hypothetical protein
MGKFKEFRMEPLAYKEALHMITPPPLMTHVPKPDWGDGASVLEALDNNSSPWWVTRAGTPAYDDAEQQQKPSRDDEGCTCGNWLQLRLRKQCAQSMGIQINVM